MNTIQPYVNQIITGDCIKVMKNFPSGSIDFIATDPPYLVNYRSRDGRAYANDDPRDSSWLKPAFAEVYRVLKPDSFCVSFYGWPRVADFMGAWRSAGFDPIGHLVWVKSYASNEKFVRYHHECAYLLAKGWPQKPHLRLPDVLEWQYSGDTLHPSQKPVLSILPLVMAYSKQKDIVLDPFCGSGTTAVAAQALGRRYIGIELDPKYAAIAEERLQKEHTHEKAIR